MNTQEYVINATKTESTDFDKITERLSQKGNVRLLHGAIGLATEAGEFLDALKKHIYYGKPLDRVNLAEELGDLFWYCAIIADELQVPFSDIMDKNIEKLKARYGEKFSEEKAENRNLKVERKILEN
ncbi:MAG: nucleoside triphosphate pyrophosphohydrolase family protein [Bdellovibrionaceae bacterium]|nr:nucleoside triphosphate pyrophosphohydrolase family protein [Pseudobdellovibrionaceae bacterium]